ncbi:MAG: type II toxin-antitoxin system VapC family toxin [Rubrobacteraceae bacterium]
MSSVVVDTDVVSYLFRRDSRAELYRPRLDGNLLVISFMTVAELDRWALERDWGEPRRRRMEEHLGNFVVYPYNPQMCREWAKVSDEARRKGRPVGVADAWIAATALLHEMPLVTHNREHFSDIEGLEVISEAP